MEASFEKQILLLKNPHSKRSRLTWGDPSFSSILFYFSNNLSNTCRQKFAAPSLSLIVVESKVVLRHSWAAEKNVCRQTLQSKYSSSFGIAFMIEGVCTNRIPQYDRKLFIFLWSSQRQHFPDWSGLNWANVKSREAVKYAQRSYWKGNLNTVHWYICSDHIFKSLVLPALYLKICTRMYALIILLSCWPWLSYFRVGPSRML